MRLWCSHLTHWTQSPPLPFQNHSPHYGYRGVGLSGVQKTAYRGIRLQPAPPVNAHPPGLALAFVVTTLPNTLKQEDPAGSGTMVK